MSGSYATQFSILAEKRFCHLESSLQLLDKKAKLYNKQSAKILISLRIIFTFVSNAKWNTE